MTATGVLDLTPAQYHADHEALSASGARKLLSSPAKFRYEQQHPPGPKRVFELGHAAHRVALGAGAELDVLDFADYRTKAAQGAARAARAMGKIPVLAPEWAQVQQMHAALLEHPLASRLLSGGRAEVPLRWIDPTFGITCRALVDYMREGGELFVDYKTCESAQRDALTRSVAKYGYDVQLWWYLDGAAQLGLSRANGSQFPSAFVFVAQEKTPPYLVRCFDLDDEFVAGGRARALVARERFRDCTASGIWPGYPHTIATLARPRWHDHTDEEF